MKSESTSGDASRRSPRALAAGVFSAALAVLLYWRPLSQWLGALSADGQLETSTAAFLDSFWMLAAGAAAIFVACGLWYTVRVSLGAAATAPPPGAGAGRAYVPLACALLSLAVRLVAATYADIGLGDDGARVFWLRQWLQDPHPVWSGLWVPAPLYLHALVWSLVRDTVWAGIWTSALAAAGATWILVRAVQEDWGKGAAVFAGAAMALLPVSVAYGSNPDVNPVFAFGVVAAIGAARRFSQTSRRRWVLVSWLALAVASWSRLETLFLVPGVALVYAPRWRTAFAFALLALVPVAAWHLGDYVATREAARVVHVIQRDPALQSSVPAAMFSFLGAVWQAVTLPCIVLGVLGMLRALRARRGLEWIAAPLLHLAALAGAVVLFGAGTQSRYLILVATIGAAYAGVALGGVLQRSKGVAIALAVLCAGLFVVAPPLFSGGNNLWLRRNPELRALVDAVHRQSAGRDVVWVAEESAFFYPCRVDVAVDRYHAMSRGDSDPNEVLRGLQHTDRALACVQVNSSIASERWAAFLAAAGASWSVALRQEIGGYRVYDLERSPS